VGVCRRCPRLTLITAAKRNKGKAKWKDTPVDRSNFRLAMLLSALIWLGTGAIFIFEAVGALKIFDILPATGLIFTLAQTVIIGAVSGIAFANR
jgi:hypothetical protein